MFPPTPAHINGSINKSIDAFAGSGSLFCNDRLFSFGNRDIDTIINLFVVSVVGFDARLAIFLFGHASTPFFIALVQYIREELAVIYAPYLRNG